MFRCSTIADNFLLLVNDCLTKDHKGLSYTGQATNSSFSDDYPKIKKELDLVQVKLPKTHLLIFRAFHDDCTSVPSPRQRLLNQRSQVLVLYRTSFQQLIF